MPEGRIPSGSACPPPFPDSLLWKRGHRMFTSWPWVPGPRCHKPLFPEFFLSHHESHTCEGLGTQGLNCLQ